MASNITPFLSGSHLAGSAHLSGAAATVATEAASAVSTTAASTITGSISATAGRGPSWGKVGLVAGAALAVGALGFAAYRWYTSSSEEPTLAGRATDSAAGSSAVSILAQTAAPVDTTIAAAPAPAPTTIIPARPEARPAASVRSDVEIQTERFTNAVKNYLRAAIPLDAKTFSLQAYCNFIRVQKNANPMVTEETMHRIVTQQFMSIRGSEAPSFIAALQDHSTLDAEVARAQARAIELERELRARDATLAGPTRFKGTIDAAWNTYFGAQKEFIRALAPLCKYMAGEKTSLTRHESDTLTWTLAHSNYKYGRQELEALEKGLKGLATGNPAISTSDLLSRASGLQGTETYIAAVQSAVERVDAAFETYRELDDERIRIAGRGVNPAVEAAAADSELAHVLDSVTDAEERKAQLILERAEKVRFIQTLSDAATLQASYDAVPADHRRIESRSEVTTA